MSHFVGHYFHYDSKFYQTIRALLFSPGTLTLAYWNKQRARYIPPISLYIFISAVYFLLSFTVRGGFFDEHSIVDKKVPKAAIKHGVSFANGPDAKDNEAIVFSFDSTEQPDAGVGPSLKSGNAIASVFEKKLIKIKREHGSVSEFIAEKLNHNIPKLFFFMIPILALLIKLCYLKRKDLFFVDHAIFSIHFQSFWFSLFILRLINISPVIDQILKAVLLVTASVYMVLALRAAYGTGVLRAIFYTLFVGVAYALFLGLFFMIDLIAIIYMT